MSPPAGLGMGFPFTFSPKSIPNLLVWLDSTKQCTPTTWIDQSANAFSFTGHGTPTVSRSATYGNRQVVTLAAGSSQFYSFDNGFFPIFFDTFPFTTVVAYNYTGGLGAIQTWAIVGADTGTLGVPNIFTNTGPNQWFYEASLTAKIDSSSHFSADSTVHIVAVTVDASANGTVYADGVSVASGSLTSAVAGNGMQVGASNTVNFFTGSIAAALVYRRILNAGELAQLREYLKNEFTI